MTDVASSRGGATTAASNPFDSDRSATDGQRISDHEDDSRRRRQEKSYEFLDNIVGVPDGITVPPMYSCPDPPPTFIQATNTTDNSTYPHPIETKVHDVDFFFDYEIQHAPLVDFTEGRDSDEGEKGGPLGELEDKMLYEMWRALGAGMDSTGEDGECAGFVLPLDDENNGGGRTRKVMRRGVRGLEEDKPPIDPLEEGDDQGDNPSKERPSEIADKDGQRLTEGPAPTVILGLRTGPDDAINDAGCTSTSSKYCTAINGKMSARYSGTNEFAVVNHLTRLVRSGCENDLFHTQGALKINFSATTGIQTESGQFIPLVADPAKEEKPEVEEEEGYISQYGILFVCMLAVLGSGCAAVILFRRKKNKTRMKEEAEELRVKAVQQEEGVVEDEGQPRALSPVMEEGESVKSKRSEDSGLVMAPINVGTKGERAASPGSDVEVSLSSPTEM